MKKYILLKWKGQQEEPNTNITIDECAKNDFKEMVNWDEKTFMQNTRLINYCDKCGAENWNGEHMPTVMFSNLANKTLCQKCYAELIKWLETK